MKRHTFLPAFMQVQDGEELTDDGLADGLSLFFEQLKCQLESIAERSTRDRTLKPILYGLGNPLQDAQAVLEHWRGLKQGGN